MFLFYLCKLFGIFLIISTKILHFKFHVVQCVWQIVWQVRVINMLVFLVLLTDWCLDGFQFLDQMDDDGHMILIISFMWVLFFVYFLGRFWNWYIYERDNYSLTSTSHKRYLFVEYLLTNQNLSHLSQDSLSKTYLKIEKKKFIRKYLLVKNICQKEIWKYLSEKMFTYFTYLNRFKTSISNKWLGILFKHMLIHLCVCKSIYIWLFLNSIKIRTFERE